MSQCDPEKWARMRTFVEQLIKELEVNSELGGDRSNARVALTLFAAETNQGSAQNKTH